MHANATALVAAALILAASRARAQDDATEQRAIAACPGFALWVEAQQAGASARRPPQAQGIDAPTLPALRPELLEMQVEDQSVRGSAHGGRAPVQTLLDIDVAHLPRIKAIVDRYRFPTRAQAALMAPRLRGCSCSMRPVIRSFRRVSSQCSRHGLKAARSAANNLRC